MLCFEVQLFFTDRKEVKVMSDLAMISAGENTMEVDKVSCFLSAVMGYAPFLFDLNDTNANLNALIEAFEKLPKGDVRATLKKKWVSTAVFPNLRDLIFSYCLCMLFDLLLQCLNFP